MDGLLKVAKEMADSEKETMIMELSETIKNSDSFTKALPEMADGLQALDQLRNKGTDFATTKVEKIQSEIEENIENNKDLVKEVQESFAENLNEINKTMTGLGSRFKAFTKH